MQAFNPEPVLPVLSGRPDQVERVLKSRYHDVTTKLGPHKKELDLLIVILPDNNGSLYGKRPSPEYVHVLADILIGLDLWHFTIFVCLL